MEVYNPLRGGLISRLPNHTCRLEPVKLFLLVDSFSVLPLAPDGVYPQPVASLLVPGSQCFLTHSLILRAIKGVLSLLLGLSHGTTPEQLVVPTQLYEVSSRWVWILGRPVRPLLPTPGTHGRCGSWNHLPFLLDINLGVFLHPISTLYCVNPMHIKL